MLLKTVEKPTGREPSQQLQLVIQGLMDRLQALPTQVAGKDEPACIAPNNVPIFPGKVIKTEEPLVLTLDRCA